MRTVQNVKLQGSDARNSINIRYSKKRKGAMKIRFLFLVFAMNIASS